MTPSSTASLAAGNARTYWLKTLHQWHWISAAICLAGMVLFAATGITLNHAAQIKSKPAVLRQRAELPPDLRELLAQKATAPSAPLPPQVRAWLQSQWSLQIGAQPAEWSDDEVYLALPRAGGDAWVQIERETGAIEFESTDRGWIAYFNDLHKGRHTGVLWSWFIDLFAVACLVFSLTGLFLLQMHAGRRPGTWPLVALGVVLPLLLALLFIH